MAIVQAGSTLKFDLSGYGNTGTVSTTITVPADAELVIAAWSGFGSANYFSTGSMTFTKGGVDTAMTAATGGDASTSFWQAAAFYLALPDTGSNKTLKWDWAGAAAPSDGTGLCSVTFWKGVDTASPVRDTDGTQAGTTPYTTPTLTAQSGDLIVAWVGAFTASEGTVDSWSNLTLLGQVVASGSRADGAWATGSPSGNTTVAASTDTNIDDGGIVAIVLKAAATVTTGIGATGSLAPTATPRIFRQTMGY